MTTKFFVPRADRRLGGRYELIECLGDGSYGWVWKAQRLADSAIVAVKIPKAQGKRNEELAEGSPLVGQAPHPCVVDVYWMGRVPPEREWYVIEMEYFPSVTLAQMLDQGEEGFVASYARLLGVFEQVLEGCAPSPLRRDVPRRHQAAEHLDFWCAGRNRQRVGGASPLR